MGYATATMKRNGPEPCGLDKQIIEEEPSAYATSRSGVSPTYKKHDTPSLAGPASLEMLKNSFARKLAKTKLR